MASIKFSPPTDPFAGDPYAADGWILTSVLATSITFESGDYRLVFTGTGIADGDPPTGTLTGATLYQIDTSSGVPVEVPLIESTAPLSLTYAGLLEAISTQGFEFGGLAYLFSGDDVVSGGSGNDNISAFAGNDLVNAGGGNDYLDGGDGNDTLNGALGNDYLFGGAGADEMRGGGGDDIYVVSDVGDTVIETAGSGSYDKVELRYDAAGFLLAANVENLDIIRSGGFGEVLPVLVAAGNSASNKITVYDYFGGSSESIDGQGGNDRISTGAGDDTLDGGSGNDSLLGGLGNDLYVVDSSLDVVTEVSGGGVDTVNASVAATLAANVENLLLLGTQNLNGTGNTLVNTLTGNTGNNRLSGLDGNDSLFGGDGLDTLLGGTGNDYLDGGSGRDSLTGGDGNDSYVVNSNQDTITETSTLISEIDSVFASTTWTLGANLEYLTLTGTSALDGTGNVLANRLTGNLGNNVLAGAEGNDTLVGDQGDDRLDGGLGIDSMDGGFGNDTYVVDDLADLIVESSTSLTEIDTVESALTWTLAANLENLRLTGTAVINGTGNSLGNRMIGNSASNNLSGLLGDDVFIGGAGNDTMNGSTGFDTLIYDTFADQATIAVNVSSAGGTATSVSEGTDVLLGIEGVVGTALNDSIRDGSWSSGLINRFDGGAGNDSLDGGDGSDTLIGGLGDDTLNGGLDVSTIDLDVVDYSLATAAVTGALTGTLAVGAAETDTLTNIEGFIGSAFADSVTGNTSNNLLVGGEGRDTFVGGDGNDTMDGGLGNDSMTGGLGDDVYTVDAAADKVIESTDQGTDTVNSSISLTLQTNVERLILTGLDHLSGTGNALFNNITGNAGDNLIRGLEGSDSLLGGDGNDTIVGGAGSDTMVGGNGIDTLDFSDSDGAITGSFGASTYTLASSTGFSDSASSFENVIGSAFSDALTGDSLNNVLDGGLGDDSLNGGSGFDQVTYASSASAVNVDLSTGLATGQGTDVLSGIESVLGTLLADVIGWQNTATFSSVSLSLQGAAGNDSLISSSGADTLDGGTGADTMTGGAGNDTYYADDLADTIVDSSGTDKLLSSVNVLSLQATLENLQLLGGATTGLGNAANNSLSGNELANTMGGDLGADTLNGGLGADSLSGGADLVADRFVYTLVDESSLAASDVISDFDDARDIIDLGLIDANTLDISTNSTFLFIGGSGFSGAAGELRTEVAVDGLSTWVFGDVNGDAIADFQLQLTGAKFLTSTDFTL